MVDQRRSQPIIIRNIKTHVRADAIIMSNIYNVLGRTLSSRAYVNNKEIKRCDVK